MTNNTNGAKFAEMLFDMAGRASKLPDWPDEARRVNVKLMKQQLDEFKVALLKWDKNSPELNWFNNEIPLVKKSLNKCATVKPSEHDLETHSRYAMEKLEYLENMAKDMDAGYSE